MKRFFAEILLIVAFFFAIFIAVNFVSLQQTAIHYTEESLKKHAQALEKDFTISDGALNSSAYYQDTSLPYDNVVYIISRDGFVIERSKFLPGLLDASHTSFAHTFFEPKTFTGPGGIVWRVLSKKIERNNKEEGTILVAYNSPHMRILSDIDVELKNDTEHIDKMITVSHNKLDISRVNSRQIKYTTYYQIIDKFNRLLVDEGAPPSYIDKSYIADYIDTSGTFTKNDVRTGEMYLFFTQPLLKDQGFILVGKSIQDFETVISKQRTIMITSSLVLLSLICIVLITLKRELISIVTAKVHEKIHAITTPVYITPTDISLDYENGLLKINDRSIDIGYGSKQCDFCKTLMSAPHKKWEQDEITDKLLLHDEDIHPRTFYDIRKSINKKVRPLVGFDYIEYDQKRFFINPQVATFIKKPLKK